MNKLSFVAMLFVGALIPHSVSGDMRAGNLLFVANQIEHTVSIVDTMSKQVVANGGLACPMAFPPHPLYAI
jgi:hypothetical protein